jgi:hypothetical protein
MSMKVWKNLLIILAIALSGGLFTACEVTVDSGSTPETTQETTTPAEEPAAEEAPASEEGEEAAAETEEGTEEAGAEEYEPAVFTLVNKTSRPLLELYVSPPGDEYWGENIVPEGEYLEPGGEAEVTIDDGLPDCMYDIKGRLGASADGSVGEGDLIHSGVEICDGTVYTYTEQ